MATAEQHVSDLERRLDDCQRSKDEAEKRLSDLGSNTDEWFLKVTYCSPSLLLLVVRHFFSSLLSL